MAAFAPHERELHDAALDAWRRGEDVARSFGVVVGLWYPRLHRYFASRSGDEARAHDLTQETFVRIYTGVSGFQGEASFETWLFTVAGNVLRKDWRDRRTLKRGAGVAEASLEEIAEAGELPGDEPDPLATAIRGQQLEQLRAAIEELPGKMRAVLKLHFYQERSRQEIADALGISAETVKAHLLQARRRLTAILLGRDAEEKP